MSIISNSTDTDTTKLPPTGYWSTDASKYGYYDVASVVGLVFCSLALYNSLGLLTMVLSTFKSRKSLYFWSMLVSSGGLMPYASGIIFEFYGIGPLWFPITIDGIGWAMVVTGQSVVLYSRLYLVLKNKTILRTMKWIIIFNAITLDTTTNILDYLWTYNKPGPYIRQVYGNIEKYQMTMYFAQELCLSSLYIWSIWNLLKDSPKQEVRNIFLQLFAINVIIILMDIAVLAIEYIGLYSTQLAVKAFIYSAKLKLEFAVLGRLVFIAQTQTRRLSAEGIFADPEAYISTSKPDPSTLKSDSCPDIQSSEKRRK